MKQITVGVIGAGRIGKVHTMSMANQLPNVRIKWIADYKEDVIGDWIYQYGIEHKTGNHLDILNDPEVDAVLICSSTDTHAQFIIDAAKAGKHIFCEKPIAHDVDQIKRALQAVKEAGVKLMIGFNRRFDHNFKKVKEMILQDEVGTPQFIKITSRDPGPPPIEYVKVSGGIFMDMTIHDFDMARFLADSEVDEVYVVGAVNVDPAIGQAGDIDTAMITMKMKNGIICTIDNSRKAAYGYDQRVEVFGSKGALEIANDTASSVKLSTANGVCTEKPLHFFLERYMAAYTAEIKAFIEAIENDSETPVSGNDGLEPVYIALACKRSYQTGQPQKVEQFK